MRFQASYVVFGRSAIFCWFKFIILDSHFFVKFSSVGFVRQSMDICIIDVCVNLVFALVWSVVKFCLTILRLSCFFFRILLSNGFSSEIFLNHFKVKLLFLSYSTQQWLQFTDSFHYPKGSSLLIPKTIASEAKMIPTLFSFI